MTGSVKGFFANVETDDRKRCNDDCVVIDPATGQAFTSSSLVDKDRPRSRLFGAAKSS